MMYALCKLKMQMSVAASFSGSGLLICEYVDDGWQVAG